MNSLTTSHPTTENTVKIVVTEVIGDHLCIASEDGQKVYEQITAAFEEGKNVILSFKDIQESVPAFMDTAIGQLYKHFTKEQIQKKLRVVDIDADGADDIENAVYWTKEYLKDPEKFRKAGRDFLGVNDE